jgi:CheY-like chemotaxis protein
MLTTVFDLFTQDKQTLERAGGGLGIGLTIVKRLVELHGGTVSAASEGPNKGSAFTVRFPRSKDAPERSIASDCEAHPVPSPKRVLVVEDNADIRESLGLILGMWGHRVEFAATGSDGLKRARDFKPDVALIDIGVPELNGYDVARGIRDDDTSWAKVVTLVALTGYGRDSDRERALAAGFDAHLVKPIDPDVLAQTLAITRH